MLDATVNKPRRINWQNVSTSGVGCDLIGAEVFGAAFAGGWALANLFSIGLIGEYILTAAFCVPRHRRDDGVRAQRHEGRAVHAARS